MCRPPRPQPRRLARAATLAGTTAVLALGVATGAHAAAADDSGGENKAIAAQPVAAAVIGIALGVAGFAVSEAGEGPYPEEHH